MDQNSSSNVDTKFILKDNYTIDKTNYEKIKLSEEYNQLYSNEYRENLKNKQEYDNEKIFNLSFSKLIKNASIVYMEIVSELSNYLQKENKTLNELGLIFTNGDRLLYIGLLILVLSFSLWIINISQ